MKHHLGMMAGCILGIVVLLLLSISGTGAIWLPAVLVACCALMMLFMMRRTYGSSAHQEGSDPPTRNG